MSQTIDVNGQSINYPETGDTNWGDEGSEFAVQTSAAFGKIGLASGTSVDIAQTLDVTGNTTLDANLSVGGNATISGTTSLTGNVTLANNLTVNGNTALGNANTDTITVTGIVNVDSGILYVDPINSTVGVNKTNPAQSLDVVGNAAISGNETIGGTLNVTGATSLSSTLGVTGDVAINTNKFNVTGSSGNTTIAGTLGISNGTASAPSLTPSEDTNTGLYSIGSDKIGFAANGARQGEFGVGYGGFTGNIIQVQSTTKTDSFSTSSTTITDITGLSVTITPKYTTSRIFIICSMLMDTSGAIFAPLYLARNGTNIILGDVAGLRTRTTLFNYSPASDEMKTFSFQYLDSPSSTSSLTYNIRGYVLVSGTLFVNRMRDDVDSSNRLRGVSTITVMEVQQ